MKKRIYLDYAATTPVLPELIPVMTRTMTGDFGNPSSAHEEGRKAKACLQQARRQVAPAMQAESDEIFFTSGGTEANCLAIAGLARGGKEKGNHLITSSIEHKSVLGTFRFLEKEGFQVTYLPVGSDGIVQPETLANAIRKETALISIQWANNEIGTVQPVSELLEISKTHGILFHADAVQAFPYLPLNVKKLPLDAATISSHKIYGPKGAGAFFLRRGVPYQPGFPGGSQERSFRPGTENVAGIAGFGKAAEILTDTRQEDVEKILPLRNRLRDGLLEEVPGSFLNGDRERRLPGNVNIAFRSVDGEALLIRLDLEGISCSLGSACSAGSQEPSHVLLAIGSSLEEARSSLRFTLGKYTTKEEIETVLKVLPPMVEKLRSLQATTRAS